jgi:hypothetical protein
VNSLLPEFHPYSSFTWNVMMTDSAGLEEQVETAKKLDAI